jgi:hypothetical protein
VQLLVRLDCGCLRVLSDGDLLRLIPSDLDARLVDAHDAHRCPPSAGTAVGESAP